MKTYLKELFKIAGKAVFTTLLIIGILVVAQKFINLPFVQASIEDLSTRIQVQKAGTQHVNSPFIGMTPNKTTTLSFDDQLYKHTAPIRVYYLNTPYETGKYKIIKIWVKSSGQLPPEALQDTAINVPYSVIEIDTEYSPTARDLIQWGEQGKYYVDTKNEIIEVVGWKPPSPMMR